MHFERTECLALLAKRFETFTPGEFYNYVISLRDENFKKKTTTKKPYQAVSVSKNKKGTFIVRCRREPKKVMRKEIDHISKALGESYLTIWELFQKRKIKIVEVVNDIEEIKNSIKTCHLKTTML